MKREVILTRQPVAVVLGPLPERKGTTGGAVVQFQGVVRGTEAGRPILGLDYSAHEAMAYHQFGLLLDRLSARWPVESVHLIHRLGPVEAGEVSLWVEVVAPHRGEAFAACQWLIDEMKQVVPIWKAVLPRDVG